MDEDLDRETQPHPALATPDPGAGGSFVGFGDVGMEAGMEGAIVPDRFDDRPDAPSNATAKLRRDDVVPRGGAETPGPSGAGAASAAKPPHDGFSEPFEAVFDLDDEASPDSAAGALPEEETIGWAPPPEAPPAETWQAIDEPEESTARKASPRMPPDDPAPVPRPAVGRGRPEPAADGRNVALTPEMIDLIAEKVVERLADRVVREVAWEVVPGVAEALVRKRIKELEDSGS